MFEFLQTLREKVAGYKTYIVAVIGILTAAVAWSGGELTDVQFIGAVWVALQVLFVRAGNKKDVANRVRILNVRVVEDAYDAGLCDGNEDGYESGFVDGYDAGNEDTRYEDEA